MLYVIYASFKNKSARFDEFHNFVEISSLLEISHYSYLRELISIVLFDAFLVIFFTKCETSTASF